MKKHELKNFATEIAPWKHHKAAWLLIITEVKFWKAFQCKQPGQKVILTEAE